MSTWELSNLMAQNVPARAKHNIKSQDEILSNLMDKNPFAALSNEESDGNSITAKEAQFPFDPKPRREWKPKASTEPGPTVVASLSEYPWVTKVSQGTRKKWKRHMAKLPPVMEEAELSNVESRAPHNDGRRIELTIDSGAAEHVVGPRDLPHIPIAPSRKHVQYTMANGHKTTNRGEQQVMALTHEGQEITFKAQVTDVHRPLMSVSRICDKGHRVVFESHGGYIESLTIGERIHVRRDHNVYRLQVDVPESGFTRQGVNKYTYP